MRSTYRVLLSLLGSLCLAAAFAQGPVDLVGDAAAGSEIASTVCFACHGPDGNSVMEAYPRLAGQGSSYLLDQLDMLRTGQRPSPIMNPVAGALSEQDVADLVAYFSSQEPAGEPWDGQDATLVERGETVYANGIVENGTVACIVCHGPTGEGVEALRIPRVFGQAPGYLGSVLGEFAMVPDFGVAQANAMHIVAASLSEDDVGALIAYLASQSWGN